LPGPDLPRVPGALVFDVPRLRRREVDVRKKRELHSAPVDATPIGNGIRERVRE
jgi:hypothetical protein